MDVLEILVLLIALVLIALVVSVVLVIVQALTGRKKKAVMAAASVEAPVSIAQPIAAVRVEPVMPDTAVTAPEKTMSDNATGVQADETAKTGDNPAPDHSSGEGNQVTNESRHEADKKRTFAIADNELRRPAVEAEANPVPQSGERYPYMAGGPLLSPIERLFYGDLKASVSDKTEIFCKVRASDVINPKASLSFEEMQFASEQLATQRFDFVLCDSKDFSVICVIELDGLAEQEGLRKLQREILRKSAESANLPILLVDMKRGYTIKEIRDRVSYLLPRDTDSFVSDGRMGSGRGGQIAEMVLDDDDDDDILVAELEEEHESVSETVSEPPPPVEVTVEPVASEIKKEAESGTHSAHQTLCPRCHSPLKMTMATTGEFAGRYFWICSKLPECPYVAPINPPE
jgi:hypothetical protein